MLTLYCTTVLISSTTVLHSTPNYSNVKSLQYYNTVEVEQLSTTILQYSRSGVVIQTLLLSLQSQCRRQASLQYWGHILLHYSTFQNSTVQFSKFCTVYYSSVLYHPVQCRREFFCPVQYSAWWILLYSAINSSQTSSPAHFSPF